MSDLTAATLSIRRLRNEDREVMSLYVPGFLEIKKGASPGSYRVTVHGDSYVGTGSGGVKREPGPYVFRVTCPSRYPTEAPAVRFDAKVPAHINVYPTRRVCIGKWQGWGDSLAALILRTVRLVLFYPDSMNFHSAANSDYITANRTLIKEGKCPTDGRTLPGMVRP